MTLKRSRSFDVIVLKPLTMLSALQIKTDTCTNSVDADEMAQNKPRSIHIHIAEQLAFLTANHSSVMGRGEKCLKIIFLSANALCKFFIYNNLSIGSYKPECGSRSDATECSI